MVPTAVEDGFKINVSLWHTLGKQNLCIFLRQDDLGRIVLGLLIVSTCI